MKVVVTPEAQAELSEIWIWNANDRGVHHADAYLAFLDKHIGALSETYAMGRIVEIRSDLRYIQMRWNARGHGHVAVYTVGINAVTVIHVFHTSQNWQAKLREEPLSA